MRLFSALLLSFFGAHLICDISISLFGKELIPTLLTVVVCLAWGWYSPAMVDWVTGDEK